MLSLFYGNPVLVREAVRHRIAAFLESHPQGLVERLNLQEEAHRNRLVAMLKTRSFFEEKRLAVVTEGFSSSNKDLAKLIEERGKEDDPELVLQEFGVEVERANQTLFAIIKKGSNMVRSFEEAKGAKLEQWATGRLQAGGLNISTKALRQLLWMTGFSMEKLEKEIAKLMAYRAYRGLLAAGESKLIQEEEIKLLVQAETEVNSFELVDAIANKDQRRGVELLHTHLAAGEDPYAILGRLVYQFRNLLKIKALVKKPVLYANLAEVTKLHPFVVKKTYEQSKKFEREDLKRIYQQLLALEVGTKDGRLELPLSLYEFLLKI